MKILVEGATGKPGKCTPGIEERYNCKCACAITLTLTNRKQAVKFRIGK